MVRTAQLELLQILVQAREPNDCATDHDDVPGVSPMIAPTMNGGAANDHHAPAPGRVQRHWQPWRCDVGARHGSRERRHVSPASTSVGPTSVRGARITACVVGREDESTRRIRSVIVRALDGSAQRQVRARTATTGQHEIGRSSLSPFEVA